MRFCSNCGHAVKQEIPEGDLLPRYVCPACKSIHYVNPKVVTACIVESDNGILMCKRAITPRHGYWTIPGGFLEMNESTMAGARRETYEESGAEVQIIAPFAHIDLIHLGQIYVIFRATFVQGDIGPTSESSEVRWVALDDIPWSQLAFPVIETALQLYINEHPADHKHIHIGALRGEQNYHLGRSYDASLQEYLKIVASSE